MKAEGGDSAEWKPRSNPWLIAATVALAAFMEVLDTSIANVALPHIAGDLGASTSQGTWVLTSYLVSNALECDEMLDIFCNGPPFRRHSKCPLFRSQTIHKLQYLCFA